MDTSVNQIPAVPNYSIVSAGECKEIVTLTSNKNIMEKSVIQCFTESDNCPEETFAEEIVCVSTEKEDNGDTNQGKDLFEKKIIEVLSSENVENICFIDNIKQEYTVTELHGALNVTSDSYFQPLTYQDLNLIYHDTETCGIHTCDVCGKGFRKKSNLKRHYRSHTGDNPFPCHQCDACFPTKSRLKEHLHAHTGLRPYVCDVCGKTFSRISNLTRHHRTHNSDKPFQCDKCDSRFIELTRLREHYLTHVGEKKFECEVCSKRFLKKYNLKRHLRTHTGEHQHSCNVCGRGFSKKIYLLVHLETHAKSDPGKKKLNDSDDMLAVEANSAIENVASNCVIECSDFDIPSDENSQLHSDVFSDANSQSTNDQENKIFSCGQCSRHYLRESSLISHLKRHEEKDPLSCKVCNATFTHASRLKEHFVTHSGEKAYTCAMCERSFGRNSNLLRHLQTHTGEKRFACNVCNKRLSSARRLDEHVLSHTGDKPHECNICNKLFRHKFGLQRHLLTHTGEKPHKCEFCGKRFNRKGRLTMHVGKHHKQGDEKFLNRVEPRLKNIIQKLEARLSEPLEEKSAKKGRKRKKRLEELEEMTIQITSSSDLVDDSFHNLRSRSRSKCKKRAPTKSKSHKQKLNKRGKNLDKEKTEKKSYNFKTRNSKDKPSVDQTSKSKARVCNVSNSKRGALKRNSIVESKLENKCEEVVEQMEDTSRTSGHVEIDDISVYQTRMIDNSLDTIVLVKAPL